MTLTEDWDQLSTEEKYEKRFENFMNPDIDFVSKEVEEKYKKRVKRLKDVVELKKPDNAICKNTVEATQSGIFYGFIGQVEKLINKFQEEIAEDPKIVATGGYSELIGSKTAAIEYIAPFLTLDGLNYLAEINDLKKVSKKWRLQEKK